MADIAIPETRSVPDGQKAVAVWLLVVCGAVFAMVVLGGVTRLTNSGLSIVDWRPITGVLPPLSDAGWREAFARYQESLGDQRLISQRHGVARYPQPPGHGAG